MEGSTFSQLFCLLKFGGNCARASRFTAVKHNCVISDIVTCVLPVQWYDPLELIHLSSVTQLCIPSSHSFISETSLNADRAILLLLALSPLYVKICKFRNTLPKNR